MRIYSSNIDNGHAIAHHTRPEIGSQERRCAEDCCRNIDTREGTKQLVHVPTCRCNGIRATAHTSDSPGIVIPAARSLVDALIVLIRMLKSACLV